MDQSLRHHPSVLLTALLALLALLLAGCGPTSQQPVVSPPASQKGPIAPAIGGTQTAIQEPTSGGALAASHGGPVADQVSFLDALRKGGSRVTIGPAVQQPFLSVGGTTAVLNAIEVQVFEYPDDAAAQADLPRLIAAVNGTSPTKVAWTGTPHAYAIGRIIVLYVGDDPDTLQRLQALLGAPQALAPPTPRQALSNRA